MALTLALARDLGTVQTRSLRSSELGVQGAKTDRLLSVLNAIGASHYISGPAATDYIDERKLRRSEIVLEYMTYDYPVYCQPYPPFDPFVSVLDLLLLTGPEAATYIWGYGGSEGSSWLRGHHCHAK